MLRVAFYGSNQDSFMVELVSLVIHTIVDGGTRTIYFPGSIPKDLWMHDNKSGNPHSTRLVIRLDMQVECGGLSDLGIT